MLVIPTAVPPHKQLKRGATQEQRLAMCRIAFSDLPVTVSDIEMKRGGKSYTVDTLKQLSQEGRRLVLLCGTDMFLSLDTWYRAETIFTLADIVYARREQDPENDALLSKQAEMYQKRFGATVRPLSSSVIEISSSEVREVLAKGKDTTAFLHPDVRRYIQEWQLYRN